MVANSHGDGYSNKQINLQHKSKPIWAAALKQDVVDKVEDLIVKAHHEDFHMPKSRANKECQNHEQVDQRVLEMKMTFPLFEK